jgi:hypothetical protein
MNFIETSAFTRNLVELLPDDNYAVLQLTLKGKPDLGDIIQGSGGIRKMRWNMPGRGKRGGVRVIYYWAVSKDLIYMLSIYAKNRKDDLSSQEIKAMRQIVEEVL